MKKEVITLIRKTGAKLQTVAGKSGIEVRLIAADGSDVTSRLFAIVGKRSLSLNEIVEAQRVASA